MLKQEWLKRTSKYTKDTASSTLYFDRLVERYKEPHRKYHTVNHVENILSVAGLFFQNSISDEFFFAACYHDSIYDVTRHDNELASSDLAICELTKLNIPSNIISTVSTMIIHTADHMHIDENEDMLMKIFLDSDISILGAVADSYLAYVNDVRQEYEIYPNELFYAGRKLFIEKLLGSAYIFRTEQYRKLYEMQARINLSNEIKSYI